MTKREEKISSLLKQLSSEFLVRLDLGKNFTTITHVTLSKNLKSAKIFISVYPSTSEKKVLKIIKEKRCNMQNFVASKTKLKFLPRLEFEIDEGEKNRQRIEELLKKE